VQPDFYDVRPQPEHMLKSTFSVRHMHGRPLSYCTVEFVQFHGSQRG